MAKKGFEFIETLYMPREKKPREKGLIFSGDWGLSKRQAEDLMEAVGEYVDLIKFAVLTARLQDRELVREKINIYKKSGVRVFPGGMTLEAAVVNKKVDEFFAEAKELGFEVIEISESEVALSPTTKFKLLETSLKKGFQTVIELGPHHANNPFYVNHIVKQANDYLKAGAWKIVLEGEVVRLMKPHEDSQAADKILTITDKIGRDNLIFETGFNPHLLVWLITNLGPEVSLGNIPATSIMATEHVRQGLNYDTCFGRMATI
jgi:phosphosulfolactate synthase